MFTRIVSACVLFLLVVGCSKKAKFTGSDDSAKIPSPADRVKLIEKDKGPQQSDKPNWLNDPRFTKKGEDGTLPTDSTGSSGKPGWGVTPPTGGWTPPNAPVLPANPNTQPGAQATEQPGIPPGAPIQPMKQPVPLPPPGGAPAAPAPATPPAQAGGKAVTKADMNDVWIFMENFSQANSGKMPPLQLVYAALVEAKSPAADLVRSGYIVLTGANTRESMWAYEANAPAKGGWIASQNGPEEVSAAEFARRVGR
jgi:hypothetical protein